MRVTVEFSQWFLPGQVQDPRTAIGAGSTTRVPLMSLSDGAEIPVPGLGARSLPAPSRQAECGQPSNLATNLSIRRRIAGARTASGRSSITQYLDTAGGHRDDDYEGPQPT
jgi:hypothetical protein